ncbi:MAG: hypothetical protein JG776_455 [Caloramator sp.]|jgi:RNase P subunit RPR2|uniref:DnaT-like ssDNA-binding protein n=1 Tax=unclassified Caloramator TaxID=2629145 RepID=UPI00040E97D6|nr:MULTISPECIES: DnaT-like ssDNA-binding protein [unclassified Caloramator]MBZ4662773.1 hypothetical protein [Caloramator sp.]
MALTEGIDSFCTLEWAEEYFRGKLYCDEWTGSDQGTKEKALKEATRRINRLSFKGTKAEPGQILQFPRIVVGVGQKIGFFGVIEQPTIPDEVKAATCEEALALLKYGNSARTKAQEQNVVRVTFGDVSEEYKGYGKLLSKEALELLKPYIAGAVVIR